MTKYAKRTILFSTRPIAPPWDEASKNFAFNLAKNVAKDNNIEAHLMTKGILKNLSQNIIQHSVYTSSQKDFHFFQKIKSLAFQFKNKNKFDIVHYFFTPTKLNSFLIKNFLKGKSKTVQTIATIREDLFCDEEIKNMLFGDAIVTYSEYTKNKLKKMGFDNVQRIYPGIDLNVYRKKRRNQKLMEKCSFGDDDFVINFTGEYVRLDAIDNVIDSFIAISKKLSNVKLSLAVRIKNTKDANEKKRIIEKLKNKRLLKDVAFHDDGNYDMSDIYNLCDISIFPVQNMKGKFDIPLTIIEAMACEKPMIVSNIPILKEFATQNNSLTIKVGDVNNLIAMILDIQRNEEKMKRISNQARKYVQENFDVEKNTKKYLKIYNELL